MNCCDEYGECRQGRDCPVRVAKVRQRFPRVPQPLRVEPSASLPPSHGLQRFVLRVIGVGYLLTILLVVATSYA